ncbi:site-2 protease family protein [Hymenobacter endophyticus]|uniref:Peptidase M50 domain-containing protein n=1 Tax=Hymenobacter endophyticus TaxID=3076335 RepID=A0ABU3TL09_9BACT|nr:site-2 protease family protein [Hymenobacter endophyticus]MDU0372053.1 hypothetical protein [Hymenobacter endophyticus]
MLVSHLETTPFGDGRWVLRTPSGRHALLSEASYRLLQLLRDVPHPEYALPRFNAEFGGAYSPAEFADLIHDQFAGLGVLAQDETPLRPLPPDPLPVRWQLLPAPVAGRLATVLQPLLGYAVLRWLLPLLLVVSPLVAWQAAHLTAGTTTHAAAGGGLLVALLLLSSLVHELGHIAACSRVGIRHGGIGVGLYLYLLPAFYADVTAIWQAPPQQRLIANAAGIVTQLVFALALAGVAVAGGWPALLPAVVTIIVMAWWQFNIFSRHDGYWLLADFTGQPLLMENARQQLRQTLQGLWPQSRPQWALLAYGLANGAATSLLLGLALLRYSHRLPELPAHLVLAGRQLLAGQWPRLSPGDLPALVFCLILGRLLLQALKWAMRQLKRLIKN